MSFLEIVPSFSVPVNKTTRFVKTVGKKRRRSFRGKTQSGERGQRPSFSLETCFREYDDSNTFRQLVHGRGEVFYFRDGLQGSKGTMPKAVGSALGFDLTLAAPFDGFIGGGIETDDPSGFIVYDMQTGNDASLNDEWTFLWLEYNRGDSAWHRSAKRSDGKFVFDGVQDDSRWVAGADAGMEWRCEVFDGLMTMRGTGANGGVLHHLVALPFLASDALIDAFMVAVKPWGPLPLLRVEGDIITEDHAFMIGQSKSADFVRVSDGVNGIVSNQLDVRFELEYAASGFFADDTVPSQGSVVSVEPAQAQSGAWSAIYNATGDATSLNFAGLSARDNPAPTTIDVLRPSSIRDYGILIVQDPDGEVDFIRTISSPDGDVTMWSRAYNEVDGSISICGKSTFQSSSIDLKNEAGTTISSLTKSDAASGEWAFWACFNADGSIRWFKTNTYSQAASSNTQQACWATACEYSESGRLFMAGGMRKLASETTGGTPIPAGDAVPVIGGISYPVVITNKNDMGGLWLCEINSATGDAINIVCNDNIFSTTADKNWTSSPSLRGANTYLKIDNATSEIHLSSNYNGKTSSGNGYIQIGRGSVSPISSRVFTDYSTAEEGKPYLVKYGFDLVPSVVVTVEGETTNQKSYSAIPAISSSSIYWMWQETTAVGTPNTNRNPAPYASNAPAVYAGLGAGNIQKMNKADYSDPRLSGSFNLGLFLPTTAAADETKLAHMQMNIDETMLLISCISLQGVNTGTWDFLDDAADVWQKLQSQIIAADPDTGSLIWRAKERGRSINEHAQAAAYIQYESGPKAGKIYSVVYFGAGNDTSTNYGPEDSDGSLAYNLKGTWPTIMNPFDGSFVVVVRDAATGNVILPECYSLMSCDRQEPNGRVIDFGVH